MEINRYEFEILEIGEPRTVGDPSLRETPELPSILSRMGTSTVELGRHLGAGVAIAGGSVLLLTYAAYLILEGVVNAAFSLLNGVEYQISFTNFQKATENYIAFLKENF